MQFSENHLKSGPAQQRIQVTKDARCSKIEKWEEVTMKRDLV